MNTQEFLNPQEGVCGTGTLSSTFPPGPSQQQQMPVQVQLNPQQQQQAQQQVPVEEEGIVQRQQQVHQDYFYLAKGKAIKPDEGDRAFALGN